jgi:nucleoprotein TPR
VHDLTGQLAERDAAYASEAAGLQRLVQMLEGRESAARATLDRIERDWAAVGDRADAREAALRADADEAAARADAAEARVRQLEAALSGVGGGALSLPGTPGAPGTPLRGTPGGEFGMFGLSPTVALASRTQKSGKTFTEVYSDYVRLQDEFAKKNAEYDHMERTLAGVIQQIEERVRILQRA